LNFLNKQKYKSYNQKSVSLAIYSFTNSFCSLRFNSTDFLRLDLYFLLFLIEFIKLKPSS